jgi:hypothetical protein
MFLLGRRRRLGAEGVGAGGGEKGINFLRRCSFVACCVALPARVLQYNSANTVPGTLFKK